MSKALSATPNLETILLDAKGKASEYQYLMWRVAKEIEHIYCEHRFEKENGLFDSLEDFIKDYQKTEDMSVYIKLKVVFL